MTKKCPHCVHRSTPGPTPLHREDRDHAPIEWITYTQRLQLDTDLANLPELADHLDRNYAALLAAGSRNPDDPHQRYPISPHVLDLADRRGEFDDPIGEADLARRMGSRRLGLLPTLASWVDLAAGEMTDVDASHTHPVRGVDPATGARLAGRISVTSEAGWLRRHLDWIAGQQWVIELAGEIRDMVVDLEQLVGDGTTHHHAALTGPEVEQLIGIPWSTLRRWDRSGWITSCGVDAHGRKLYASRDVRSVARSSARITNL